MKRLDILYRAFTDYRKNTSESRDCVRSRNLFARANTEGDSVEYERINCVIDDDWIEAIEKGLVCIQKAIDEERQFIRNNGEVVPIEKVKKVSKESVDHLSRHSNLLTRYTEGEDIIPDQLFTVELLSDFAVYENRFLYMTLCYLRDFITLRYDKILEYCNTYNGRLRMTKTVRTDGRNSTFTVSLDDSIYYEFLTDDDKKTKGQIDRIGTALRDVMAYLATPLMEAVAKAPMLKPPITETNVLKMNRNFNGALQLYYFITAYDKPGYTTNKATTLRHPFTEEYADKFAEVAELCSLLTYVYGTGTESVLKARYLEAERRRKEQEEERLRQQIEKLRRSIKDSGVSPEEYMLMLERRNMQLEKESTQLKLARAEIERQNAEIAQLNHEIAEMGKAIEDGRAELERQTEKFSAELAEVKEEGERVLAEMKAQHEKEMQALSATHSQAMSALRQSHTAEIERINASHVEQTQALKDELGERSAACDEAMSQMEALKLSHQSAVTEYETRIEKLRNDYRMINARYNAVRRQYGLFTAKDDFTSQESFDELERQYEMFTKFFKEEWKKAKKRIRRETLRAAKEDKDGKGGKDAEDGEGRN